MSSSNQDDEDDIYEDLPDFQLDETISKLEEANISLQKRLAELQDVIVDLNKEIKSLHRERSHLKSQNATLSTNISSLYKTAISEVKRKDNIIRELREENYTFLKNQQSKASQKNGQQVVSSERNGRDSRDYSNHDRRESHLNGSSRHSKNDTRDRHQMQLRKESRSTERRRSRSHSPRKFPGKDSKENNRTPLQHSSKPAKSGEKSSVSEHANKDEHPSTCALKERNNFSCDQDEKTPSTSNSKVVENAVAASVKTKSNNRTYNKNLVIVDKSVPNTIYTKRLRKRILDEMERESQASDSPSVDNQKEPTENVKQAESSLVDVPPVNSKVVNCEQNQSVYILHTDRQSGASVEKNPASREGQENPPVPTPMKSAHAQHVIKSVPKIAEEKESLVESPVHAASLAAETPAKVGQCNKLNDEVVSSITSKELQSILLSSMELQKISESINTTSNQLNVSSDASKKQEVKEEFKSNSAVEKKSSVSPVNLVAPSLENVLSNSGSSSLSSSLSNGHCFKKFKKDGKTRINPIYIGPRILTQKGKNDKKNSNSVRPVTSLYSNLTNPRSPKAGRGMVKTFSTPETQTKTDTDPVVKDKLFSLFGKTPDNKEPFISSNSVFSENSLTNFSFLSSSDSPKSGKNTSPEIVLKSAPSDEVTNRQVILENQPKRAPSSTEVSESLQSREEQMASLFGDVSSDSSDVEIPNLSHSKQIVKDSRQVKHPPEMPNTRISSSSQQIDIKVNDCSVPTAIVTSNLKAPEMSPLYKTPQNSLEVTPNAPDSSLERRSFNLSQICVSITPFKNILDSSSLPFTPAREALSPIPPTPMEVVKKEDSATQAKCSNSSFEKLEAGLMINKVSPTVKSMLPMQPKAEIIQSYLPKSTSTLVNIRTPTNTNLEHSEILTETSTKNRSFDLSKIPCMQTPFKNNSADLLVSTPAQAILSPIPPTPHGALSKAAGLKSTESSSNSSGESKSLDLLKIPVMHTPFKNDDTNPLICTPAQAILSPIPPTPHGMAGKISEKSESSDLFKIIKIPDSTGSPMLIKNNINSKFEGVGSSEQKIEMDSKKDEKPSSFEDGNSNLSVNSISDKKLFLSPGDVSTAACYTPFKTFSSDSLQSFMRTPARELLSPIPKTPLGSWDIDNEKTNSCDVGSENNPNNSLLPREDIYEKNLAVIKSNSARNQPAVPLSSPPKEEGKLLPSVNKYFITQNKEPCSKVNHPSRNASLSKQQIADASTIPSVALRSTLVTDRGSLSNTRRINSVRNKISEQNSTSSKEKIVKDSSICNFEKPSTVVDKCAVFHRDKSSINMTPTCVAETIQSAEKSISISSPPATTTIKSKFSNDSNSFLDIKPVARRSTLQPKSKLEVPSVVDSHDTLSHHAYTSEGVHRKMKVEPEATHSPNNPEKSVKQPQTVSNIQGPYVGPVNTPSTVSTVRKTSPECSDISESNISISSVSEQIPFQRSSRKVRKVLICSNSVLPSEKDVRQTTLRTFKKFCPSPANDLKPSEASQQALHVCRTPSDSVLQNNQSENVSCNTSTIRVKPSVLQSDKASLLPCRLPSEKSVSETTLQTHKKFCPSSPNDLEPSGASQQTSHVLRFPSDSVLQNNQSGNVSCNTSTISVKPSVLQSDKLSPNKSASEATQGRRAVLLPMDIANNIIRNSQQKSRNRRNDAISIFKAKRSRSPSVGESDINSKRFKSISQKDEPKTKFKAPVCSTRKRAPDPAQNERRDKIRNSRSSHRKSVDRSSRDTRRYNNVAPSHRLHDRRSRSVSRCRLNYRRSVSRNLGSNYLSRAEGRSKQVKQPHSKRTSSSVESSPPSTSSESKKENRVDRFPSKSSAKPKKTELISKPMKIKSPNKDLALKQKITLVAPRKERERTASFNSSLSSVSTSDALGKNEPLSFVDWKLKNIDLPDVQKRYKAVYLSAANKNIFLPTDPRIYRQVNAPAVEGKPHGPQASSTPKMIKRKTKNVTLGDSTQVVSPIKPMNSAVTTAPNKAHNSPNPS
ncbi:unnamed protein product [Bemisia tabaci]|uniref:CASP8-associated protein 2 n=1 Tax=Bemisia tabaci TaxID=7038 RepID=A0A9P0AKC0_BEMTA|nr:unnamed protein product [Bemisia tabaci]